MVDEQGEEFLEQGMLEFPKVDQKAVPQVLEVQVVCLVTQGQEISI